MSERIGLSSTFFPIKAGNSYTTPFHILFRNFYLWQNMSCTPSLLLILINEIQEHLHGVFTEPDLDLRWFLSCYHWCICEICGVLLTPRLSIPRL